MRKRGPARILARYVILIVIAGTSFAVGRNLRHYLPHHPKVHVIDAASVTILPSSTAATTLVQTADGRAVVITSDFGPYATDPLLDLLHAKHIRSVDAVILTSVTPNTAEGIKRLRDGITIGGPVVTPYGSADRVRWSDRSERNLKLGLEKLGLGVVSWNLCTPALAAAIPEASFLVMAPTRTRWETQSILVRVSYGESSLLDLTSLTPRQMAELTGLPIGGTARVILVNGQDQFLSKEILSEIQPDVVVLTGSPDEPPGDAALADVRASDAVPISLAVIPKLVLDLPSSGSQQISVSKE